MAKNDAELRLPRTGVTAQAPPMAYDPTPIKHVVYGLIGCVAIGYGVWLYCLATGQMKDWPWTLISVFALHTVGIFAGLIIYFGARLKVTASSAEAG